MSLHRRPIAPLPEETARVARAAFPKGHRYMTMREVLGVLYTEGHFTDLYEPVGQHAEPPVVYLGAADNSSACTRVFSLVVKQKH